MIDKFDGQYRFLSNFWPCTVRLDGEQYSSVEHAYQAAKTTDRKERQQVRVAPSPSDAKRLGRRVTKRTDWEDVKLEVMEKLLRQKFSRLSELGVRLRATTRGHELVEGNTWGDTYWGVCNGVGENHLGRLLMAIRDE